MVIGHEIFYNLRSILFEWMKARMDMVFSGGRYRNAGKVYGIQDIRRSIWLLLYNMILLGY